MTEFKDLSPEDQEEVKKFIRENIQKHYKEHQIYNVQVEVTDGGPGLWFDIGDEFCEPDILDSWFECTLCGDGARIYESQVTNHAMEHLGFNEKKIKADENGEWQKPKLHRSILRYFRQGDYDLIEPEEFYEIALYLKDRELVEIVDDSYPDEAMEIIQRAVKGDIDKDEMLGGLTELGLDSMTEAIGKMFDKGVFSKIVDIKLEGDENAANKD